SALCCSSVLPLAPETACSGRGPVIAPGSDLASASAWAACIALFAMLASITDYGISGGQGLFEAACAPVNSDGVRPPQGPTLVARQRLNDAQDASRQKRSLG